VVQRVGQQRDAHVPAGELLGHDPRADDHRQQQCGAEGFAQQLANQVGLHGQLR
jgi:hypothetical protein